MTQLHQPSVHEHFHPDHDSLMNDGRYSKHVAKLRNIWFVIIQIITFYCTKNSFLALRVFIADSFRLILYLTERYFISE